MIPKHSTAPAAVIKAVAGRMAPERDTLAIEEPLEIRVAFDADGKRVSKSISVTMRTPGDDYELAAGFLFTEGIIENGAAIHQISYCVGPDKEKQEYNLLSVSLRPGVRVDTERLMRHFFTSSSCGVCGKTTLDALKAMLPPRAGEAVEPAQKISAEAIHALPEKLMLAQTVFSKTGGAHGAGLFDFSGQLISVKEDVGRHNAVDKIIGEQVLAGRPALPSNGLLISGRASFEIMQKAAMAQIPIVAAVGAPSTLAVSVAKEFGMTLLGFVRGERFNIYNGEQRVGL